MSGLDKILDRLAALECRPRRNGSGWSARCPAHPDRNPSLSVSPGQERDALLFCHAGCSADAVLDALGFTWKDLGPEERPNGQRAEPDTVYDYVDEQGELLFQVCRFPNKQFRQRRPDGQGGWSWKLGSTRRVLYRLPRVLEAVHAGETVFVVEGEKDVEALERAGHTATCNPGGAGKWRDDYSKALAGADVVIVADRDEAGQRHVTDVKASLLEAGIERLRTVEARTGKDAYDHLEAGHGVEGFAVLDDTAVTLGIVTAEQFAAVDEEGAESLLGDADEALIPEDGDVMVYGDGGAGKTTLTIDLAAHLAAGDAWLGIRVPRPLTVLAIENEGPRPLFRRKLDRKLAAWGGSPIDGRLRVVEEPWAAFTFAEEAHRQALAEGIRTHGIDIVIVGPVTCAGMDEAGTLQETRAFQALLHDVRRRAGRHVTFVLIHHEGKSGKVSGAWEGTSDTLLHVTGQGHGRTRLHVQKARWAAGYHATTLTLRWAPGESFEPEEPTEIDDDTLADQILEAIGANPGTGWTRVEQETPGVKSKRRREVRDRLLTEGVIVNVGKVDGVEVRLDHVPERKPARLYPATDPTIRHLRPDPAADGTQMGLTGGGDGP